jgi:hypothetical protein
VGVVVVVVVGVGAILLSLSAMSPLFLSLSGRLLIIVLKVGWR